MFLVDGDFPPDLTKIPIPLTPCVTKKQEVPIVITTDFVDVNNVDKTIDIFYDMMSIGQTSASVHLVNIILIELFFPSVFGFILQTD